MVRRDMDFKFTPSMNRLNEAFVNHGYELYLVGGAVRDSLLGMVSKDDDFATDATPDEQIAICEAAGFRYVPTGLKHGTLSILVDDDLFEVTTFRTESEHDGRYATMTFTRNIETDLQRRDLTINAMALGFDGTLIDPFGGQDDLRNGIVRFVGCADDRIREDYLRILRWIRFHQRGANGTPFDPETVEAVKRNAEGLRQISVERIWAEISKALFYPNPYLMIEMMDQTGIAMTSGMGEGSRYWLSLAERAGTRDPVSIMAAYMTHLHIDKLAERWKWSVAERKQAIAIASLLDRSLDAEVQRYLVAVDGFRSYDVAEAARITGFETDIETWTVPIFPVTGNDLKDKGFKPGPDMGAALRRMKEQWGKSKFTLTKDELMVY